MESKKKFIDVLSKDALAKLKKHQKVIQKLIRIEAELIEQGYKIILVPINKKDK